MNSPNQSDGGLRLMVRRNPVLRTVLWPLRQLRASLAEKKEAAFDDHFQKLFSRVEGGSLIVNLPQCGGAFEIGAKSSLLRRVLKSGAYEPAIAALLLQHIPRDRDILDVGANVGFFTVMLAKNLSAGRRLLCVEPAPQALHYLRGNILCNGVDKSVIVCEGAASAQTGAAQLHVIPGKEEYSSIFDTRTPSENLDAVSQARINAWVEHAGIAHEKSAVVTIKSDTVDNMVENAGLQPGLMKIDAEGAEYQILQGALRTLAKWKPVIVSEIADIFLCKSGASSTQIVEFLEKQGYRVVDADNPAQPIAKPFEGTILATPKQ